VTVSIEARLQRLEDLQEITQLFIDYGEHLDAGDFAAYARLFAEDGEVLLGPMGRATGRSEIEALMTCNSPTVSARRSTSSAVPGSR
jgi:ketosteroid isomerase-like protein